MESQEEYHDPDYPGTSAGVSAEKSQDSEEEKISKIKAIISREFSNELEMRENEVLTMDQKMSTSRRLLQRLRYTLVSTYYNNQRLQLSSSHIQDEISAQQDPRARADVTSMLREQRRIHPSVKRLLGDKTVGLDEILLTAGPRNKARKDYSAMLQKRNYTIAADSTRSLRPETTPPPVVENSRPKKVPRQVDPKISNVLTLADVTRNKMKHRYRIIIGNTSKYAPAASRADRSTHKWLLYVRGPPPAPPPLTHVRVTLHHSYAPHDRVTLTKPPFHVSRRGWGEFPARVELHFPLPDMNRPAAVDHCVKLDRNFTGLQTLGAETVVDVWLYSTQEMLEYALPDDPEPEIDRLPDPPDNPIDGITDLVPTGLVPSTLDPGTIEIPGTTDSIGTIIPKTEPLDFMDTLNNDSINNGNENDSWLDFFSKEPAELDVDEMLIKEVKKESVEEKVVEDAEPVIKQQEDIKKEVEETPEPNEWNVEEFNENLPNEILNNPQSPKTRIVKYIDPTTRKIYYLEMDRKLDLNKVQEIVINSKGIVKTAKISPVKSNGIRSFRKNIKKGMSLLKPEVKNSLKNENITVKTEKDKILKTRNYTHIENDHCYIAMDWKNEELPVENNSDSVASNISVKKENILYECLCTNVTRMATVRAGVNYLVKNIPLICDEARDPDFVRHFPFVVENEEKYWKLDFAKRRNIEWSRAKLINQILTTNFIHKETIWRTKQILIYIRLHGHHPVRSGPIHQSPANDDWSIWNNLERRHETSIRQLYPNPDDISSLTEFETQEYVSGVPEMIKIEDTDDEVDVVGETKVTVKKEVLPDNEVFTVLPVESEDDRLRFLFLERKCADIGIELRNEDVGNGYSYSAVHAVLLSAMRSFAEELVRGALAARRGGSPVWTGWSSGPQTVLPGDVCAGLSGARLAIVSRRGLGSARVRAYSL